MAKPKLKDAYTDDWHSTKQPVIRYVVIDNTMCGDQCHCEFTDTMATFSTMSEVREFAKTATPNGWMSVDGYIVERHKYSDLRFLIHDVRERSVTKSDAAYSRVVTLRDELRKL